jgi:hypothetical protein
MTVINMMPREHHYQYATKLLPREFFKEPENVISELLAPMGGTFLFYLWEELGKVVTTPIKAVDVGQLPGPNGMTGVLKLDVVGHVQEGGTTLILISLPPTEFPGESMFVAVAQHNGTPRYFTYERNAGIASLGEDPNAAYLGEYDEAGTRTSLGSKPGTDAASFARALASVLGMSVPGVLAGLGLPTSSGQPMGSWSQASAGPAPSPGTYNAASKPGTGVLRGIGNPLVTLLTVLAFWPLGVRIFFMMFGGLLPPVFSTAVFGLRQLLTLVAIVMLMAFMYKLTELASVNESKPKYSPGMAVAYWFIPFANFIMPPFVLRHGWQKVERNQTGNLVFLWWPAYLVYTFTTVFLELFIQLQSSLSGFGGRDFLDVLFGLISAVSWMNTIAAIVAMATLASIVRTITKHA